MKVVSRPDFCKGAVQVQFISITTSPKDAVDSLSLSYIKDRKAVSHDVEQG